ncbi:MAG: 30S ribosomal protein S4 [Patescibacteria group bacterium]
MRIGPRYKIARRLGADLFEKTQSPKYVLRAARRGRDKRRPRSRSDFAAQLREKQRARLLYGLSERQFARSVQSAIERKSRRDDEALFQALETRLDNALYRLGIAPSRQAARQFAAHGHFTVNNVRITIPSYKVKAGDVIRLRKGSAGKTPFANLADNLRDRTPPAWLRFDLVKGEGTVLSAPRLKREELPFNIGAILEFYRR